MAEHPIHFRPLHDETLGLLALVYSHANGDPVATYSRLISAAVMAGALIEMMPEQMAGQVKLFMPGAHMAIKENPEIFGKSKKAQ